MSVRVEEALQELLKALQENKPNEQTENKVVQLLNMLPQKERENIVQNVLDKFADKNIEFGIRNIQSPELRANFTKALAAMTMAHIMEKLNPNLKLDLTKLFKKDLTPEDKDEFKLELKKFLTALNELHPDPNKRLKDEDIEKLADAFADYVLRPDPDNPDKAPVENEESKGMDLLLDGLTLTLTNLYGADPRNPAPTPKPIMGIVSSFANIPDRGSHPLSLAAADAYQRFDAGQPDYTGAENEIHLRLDSISGDIEDFFESNYRIESSMRPHPNH